MSSVNLETKYSKTINLEDTSIPLVITYDNLFDNHENTKMFIKTLELHNWQYAIVRISETYKNHKDKIKGYYEFLKTLPRDKIVVLSDSRDVFCCRNSCHFMKGIKFMKSNFLVSMELWCDQYLDAMGPGKYVQCIPLNDYWKYHKVHGWPLRRYVNSGLITGKIECLLHFFEFALTIDEDDDQVLMGLYMNKYPENVTADVEAILLHTSTFSKCAGARDVFIQSKDSPTFAEIFGRAAFFLHFPALSTKGQALMYNSVKLMINNELHCYKLNDLYNYKEEQYDW